MSALPTRMRCLVSDVRPDLSFIDFKLVKKPVPQIEKATDVIIRMEACPINPSDIGVIFGAARRDNAVQTSTNCVSAPIPPKFAHTFEKDNYGNSRKGGILCGNEGAGVVVAAGESAEAQALLGKVVAVFGSGGCYAEYRKASARGNSLNAMPDGITPAEAASSYVNPLTALGMLSTAVADGHSACVSTAAASQLGQMMVRIAMADNYPVVNIVRRKAQVDILRSINPNAIVVNQSDADFEDRLHEAVKSVSASVAFDATGGGALSSQLLEAIDRAGLTRAGTQLWNYGRLDTSPSTMTMGQRKRSGFWFLGAFSVKDRENFKRCMVRVRNEIKTTFATKYAARVSLEQAVSVDALRVYGGQTTGKKYLLMPFAAEFAKL
eukprot:g5182.t1